MWVYLQPHYSLTVMEVKGYGIERLTPYPAIHDSQAPQQINAISPLHTFH
jgi:hypothetical protein